MNGNGVGPNGAFAEHIFSMRRERMVEEQIVARGITDPRVLAAMRKVPRHLFVPEDQREGAYEDGPLPIGEGQTISQPYIVALMTELVAAQPESRCLEIGTGSGYQTAVLAELVKDVFTIEIISPIAARALTLLQDLDYTNVHGRIGDGSRGWPEEAPFDGILVAAAPEQIPAPLLHQLRVGGRIVIPVGSHSQDLMLITRTEIGYREETITPVRFVPMTGDVERQS